jgi:hypothetical protein
MEVCKMIPFFETDKREPQKRKIYNIDGRRVVIKMLPEELEELRRIKKIDNKY